MVKKHFTLRLTVASFLAFLSLVFASFSCQDHEVPEVPQNPVLPTIITISASKADDSNNMSYTVQFTNLGNVPVVEYGIVSYGGETNENHVPDVPAAPYVYPFYERQFAFNEFMPATLNAVTIVRPYDQSYTSNGITRLFYRAYAILNNSQVVYGEVKTYDFEYQEESDIVKPVIKTLDASKGDDSDFIAYALQFESLGNVPVNEYGIVTYQGNPNEQQTPEVPTDNPLEKKYPYAEAVNLDVKNIIKQYDGPTDGPIRLFYRAYAVLNNGEVVYGEVKFLDFEIFVPAVITTGGVGFGNGQLQFLLEIESLGNNPIIEYGIIYKSFPSPNNNYVPTFNDVKAVFSNTASPGIKSKFFQFAEPNLNFIAFRAYAIHANGEIVYGQKLVQNS